MFLKICGITRLEDARHAAAEGATALGFVFWPRSPRHVTARQAAQIIAQLPRGVEAVGVFVNESIDGIRQTVAETGITMVQLHGDEPAAYARALDGLPLLRAVTLETVLEAGRDWPASTALLLDAADPVRRGGTGTQVDWTRAADVAAVRRVILAGGLDPRNVAGAIAAVRPFGVDVSSGVEEAPGVKDFDKVSRFLVNARRALAGAAQVER